MATEPTSANHVWASLIVEELVRCGVDTFCIAPGSRSTPLTAAVALHPKAKAVVHFDERGLGYFALGFGRATGKPAPIICTSGTAVANLLPSVIEASNAQVPMILLTADRPPEMRDTGSNQTIDQVKIFGNAVRWYHELPGAFEAPAETVLTTIDHALHRATGSPAGPVHINCPFRDPLAPSTEQTHAAPALASVAEWQAGSEPYVTSCAGRKRLDEESQQIVIRYLASARRPLLVVGQLTSPAQAAAVQSFCEAAKWPMIADVTSGLRLGPNGCSAAAMLGAQSYKEFCKPDLVLYAGGAVTSKNVLQFLGKVEPKVFLRVVDHPLRHEPAHKTCVRVEAEYCNFFTWIAGANACNLDELWAKRHREFADTSHGAISQYFESHPFVSEPRVARDVSRLAPAGSTVFVGNSMPIRDFDLFADRRPDPLWIAANRGASGIDGNIATAAGIVQGADGAVTAVIGDLATLHDLNSLALLRDRKVVLVVINNDGGGIFHFLDIAKRTDVFEPYFGTPHGFGFEHAAAQFGLGYAHPATPADFEAAYTAALELDGSSIIEVTTSRVENGYVHEQLRAAVALALEQASFTE